MQQILFKYAGNVGNGSYLMLENIYHSEAAIFRSNKVTKLFQKEFGLGYGAIIYHCRSDQKIHYMIPLTASGSPDRKRLIRSDQAKDSVIYHRFCEWLDRCLSRLAVGRYRFDSFQQNSPLANGSLTLSPVPAEENNVSFHGLPVSVLLARDNPAEVRCRFGRHSPNAYFRMSTQLHEEEKGGLLMSYMYKTRQKVACVVVTGRCFNFTYSDLNRRYFLQKYDTQVTNAEITSFARGVTCLLKLGIITGFALLDFIPLFSFLGLQIRVNPSGLLIGVHRGTGFGVRGRGRNLNGFFLRVLSVLLDRTTPSVPLDCIL